MSCLKKKIAVSFGGKIKQQRVKQEWGGILSLQSCSGALQAYSHIAREALTLIVSPFTMSIKYYSHLYIYHIYPSLKTHLKILKGRKS